MLILSQLKAVSKYVSGRVKISETICQQMNSPYQPRLIQVKRVDHQQDQIQESKKLLT